MALGWGQAECERRLRKVWLMLCLRGFQPKRSWISICSIHNEPRLLMILSSHFTMCVDQPRICIEIALLSLLVTVTQLQSIRLSPSSSTSLDYLYLLRMWADLTCCTNALMIQSLWNSWMVDRDWWCWILKRRWKIKLKQSSVAEM